MTRTQDLEHWLFNKGIVGNRSESNGECSARIALEQLSVTCTGAHRADVAAAWLTDRSQNQAFYTASTPPAVTFTKNTSHPLEE